MTATTSKIAIATLSAAILLLVLSVIISKSVRFFCWEHPGILIVVIAVLGEVICDWNRKKTLKERLKKFFGMLLVAGLCIEIAEAIKSDKKVALAENDAASANERASTNEVHFAELTRSNLLLSVTVEGLKSDNLVLRSKVVTLEVKSKWREITQTQKENFIKLTKNVGKFGIRIRYGTHDAEVESFANMVMGMLNSAGFIETNVPPLEEWPPGMNILYKGGSEDGQMPSLMFLNNVEITNAPGVPYSGNDNVFYVMPDGRGNGRGIDADEFRAIISQTNNFSVVMGEGDVDVVLQETNYVLAVPSHSTRKILFVSDPNVTKIWGFLKIRAIFYSMGITAQWITTTNLSAGACEIFVNPK